MTPHRYHVQAASPGLAMLSELDASGGEEQQLPVSPGDDVPGLGQGRQHQPARHDLGREDRSRPDPVGAVVQGLVNFAQQCALVLAVLLPSFLYCSAIGLFLFAAWGLWQQAQPQNPFRGRPWIPWLSLML